MRCPECGLAAEVFPPQGLCPRCGAAVTMPPPPVPDQAPEIRSPVGATLPQAIGTLPVAPPVKARRRGRLVVGLAAGVALLAAGGAAAAGFYYGWFAGPAPATVVPGTAVGYLSLEINPSPAQKVALASFFAGTPGGDEVASGTDTRRIVWNLVTDADADTEGRLAGIDFDAEIAPWLGDRVGLAVLPGAEAAEPAFLVVVQVKDQGSAEPALVRLTEDELDVTMRDGYALLTEPKDTARVLADLAAGPLSARPGFVADLTRLGDPGIGSAWLDLDGLKAVVPADPRLDALPGLGRTVLSLRVSDDTLELTGVSDAELSAAPSAGVTGPGLGDLPGTTAVGVSLRGGGAALVEAWNEAAADADTAEFLRQLEAELATELPGVAVPTDLAALLGDRITVALDSEGLAADQGQAPRLGAVITGPDAATAKRVVDRLRAAFDPSDSLGLAYWVSSDSYLVASGQAYLNELSEGTGERLADDAGFVKAVPDHATAIASAYLAVQPLVPTADVSAEYREFVAALSGIGLQSAVADGRADWTLRLVRS